MPPRCPGVPRLCDCMRVCLSSHCHTVTQAFATLPSPCLLWPAGLGVFVAVCSATRHCLFASDCTYISLSFSTLPPTLSRTHTRSHAFSVSAPVSVSPFTPTPPHPHTQSKFVNNLMFRIDRASIAVRRGRRKKTEGNRKQEEEEE